MNPARLRAQLEADGLPPVNALRLNQQQAETLLPMVVETMDGMAEGVFMLPRQEHLLFHGFVSSEL